MWAGLNCKIFSQRYPSKCTSKIIMSGWVGLLFGTFISIAVPVLLLSAPSSAIFHRSLLCHTHRLKKKPQFPSFLFFSYHPSLHCPHLPPRHCMLFSGRSFRKTSPFQCVFVCCLHLWALLICLFSVLLSYSSALVRYLFWLYVLMVILYGLPMECNLSFWLFYRSQNDVCSDSGELIFSHDSILRQQQNFP